MRIMDKIKSKILIVNKIQKHEITSFYKRQQ
jgi:hypothetical protein